MPAASFAGVYPPCKIRRAKRVWEEILVNTWSTGVSLRGGKVDKLLRETFGERAARVVYLWLGNDVKRLFCIVFTGGLTGALGLCVNKTILLVENTGSVFYWIILLPGVSRAFLCL